MHQIRHARDLPRRGFFFWALAPFLLIFAVAMPLLVPIRDAGVAVTLIAVELPAILVFLGLYSPRRFCWTWRGVGAPIFLGYCAYLFAALIEIGGTISITPRRSEASPFNAFCGLIGLDVSIDESRIQGDIADFDIGHEILVQR